MLNPEELSRYSRQYILPEVGMDGQQKLKKAKILVIGAGGLGCPILQYLAAAGIGTLGIADFDVVDVSNLHRQILYNITDLGKSKAIVASEKLGMLNPWVEFKVFTDKIDAYNATAIVENFDVVVDGSDNFETRYIVNDACILANKPLVFGSIYKFEGQVSVFNYKGSGSYRCLFPETLGSDELPNCATIGVIGVLPGIIGTIQANEVLKIVLEIGEVMHGKLLVIDALTLQFNAYQYNKDLKNFQIDAIAENKISCAATALSPTSIAEISVQELQLKIDSNEELQLLDVRELNEYAAKNIGGIHIPLGSLRKQITKLKLEVPTVVYCQSGIRSKQAFRIMKEEFGFTNILNLSGGLNAWYANYN